MANYFVYILFSEKHNKYYIGQTNNVQRRLEEHNFSPLNSFTAMFRPWILYHTIPCQSRAIAVRIEKYLKKKKRDFLKRVKTDLDLNHYIINRFQY